MTHILSDTSLSRNLSTSSEQLARASMAAGFAMAEAIPDDSTGDKTDASAPGAVRRTWRTFEDCLARCLASWPGRPSALGAWQQ